MRATTLLALLGVLSACAPPVVPDSAEACRVEKVTSVPLRRHGAFWALDVQVDGKPAALMLDTGATGGALTTAAAARLGTRIGGGRFTVTSGAGGTIYGRSFEIDRLVVGGETVERLIVPELVGEHPLGDGYDGIIGMQTFNRYDIDIDLPGNMLGLYRRRYCPSGPPPIAGARAFRRTGPERSGDNRPMVGARLNGREGRALLDTGATVTIVDGAFATAAGAPATPGEGAAKGEVRTVAEKAQMWRHRFDRLELVGRRVESPHLWITGLGMANDLIVGQDILRRLRIWISNGSDAVYIAPAAGAPVRP